MIRWRHLGTCGIVSRGVGKNGRPAKGIGVSRLVLRRLMREMRGTVDRLLVYLKEDCISLTRVILRRECLTGMDCRRDGIIATRLICSNNNNSSMAIGTHRGRGILIRVIDMIGIVDMMSVRAMVMVLVLAMDSLRPSTDLVPVLYLVTHRPSIRTEVYDTRPCLGISGWTIRVRLRLRRRIRVVRVRERGIVSWSSLRLSGPKMNGYHLVWGRVARSARLDLSRRVSGKRNARGGRRVLQRLLEPGRGSVLGLRKVSDSRLWGCGC
jgi:hypothetical protein